MQEAYLKIYGDVHGVGFRYYAKQQADELGLAGWVRNASDGTVEAVVQGEKALLEKFISLVERGPAWARVEKVGIEWRGAGNRLYGFVVV